MEEKNMEQWQNTRSKGKWHFVLKKGLLYWGVTSGAISAILMQLILPSETWWEWPLSALFVFPLFGVFYGLSMWNYNENLFNQQENSSGSM